MKLERHTSATMTWMLVNRFPAFSPQRNLVIPNASYGLGLSWEADLLVISERGYRQEVEIKVSRADLLADAKKDKFTKILKAGALTSKQIKKFWYAVPDTLVADVPKEYLTYAGVIAVPLDTNKRCRVMYVAPQNNSAQPAPPHVIAAALRGLQLRFWDQFSRSMEPRWKQLSVSSVSRGSTPPPESTNSDDSKSPITPTAR